MSETCGSFRAEQVQKHVEVPVVETLEKVIEAQLPVPARGIGFRVWGLGLIGFRVKSLVFRV